MANLLIRFAVFFLQFPQTLQAAHSNESILELVFGLRQKKKRQPSRELPYLRQSTLFGQLFLEIFSSLDFNLLPCFISSLRVNRQISGEILSSLVISHASFCFLIFHTASRQNSWIELCKASAFSRRRSEALLSSIQLLPL